MPNNVLNAAAWPSMISGRFRVHVGFGAFTTLRAAALRRLAPAFGRRVKESETGNINSENKGGYDR
jgi:hypothetical protein